MSQQSSSYKYLESLVLEKTDQLINKTKDQKQKAIYELFKSVVLKKYQDSINVEITKREVKNETIDKYVEFVFSEACFQFRLLSNIDDKSKEEAIDYWRDMLDTIKAKMAELLALQGVKIIP